MRNPTRKGNLMYFSNVISAPARALHQTVQEKWSPTGRLVFVALMASFSAVFQSAGGFFPGVGYFISPLATAPILLGMLVSIRFGLLGYFLTLFLLLLIQPSELIVFPFTTGILGVGLGAALIYFNRRVSVIVSGAVLLCAGILLLLFVLKFPVLGPGVSSSPGFSTAGLILLFSLLYSWLWTELALLMIKKFTFRRSSLSK